MKIAVIGLGYVGTVTLACLADRGHRLLGVDVNPDKVNAISSGISPISEPGLSELLFKNVANGRISATTNLENALSESEIALITVGTPSGTNGDINLEHLLNVARAIGSYLTTVNTLRTIVLTSTVPPGTTNGIFRQTIEKESGLVAGEDFQLIFVPEFLREGSAIRDFQEPEIMVIGANEQRLGPEILQLYSSGPSEVCFTKIDEAESIKFVSNAWHALKVAFSNEIGRFLATMKIDSQEVMNVFLKDKKLNVSARYLRPGFAFGGSCLPKDVRSLTFQSSLNRSNTPIINSINSSNSVHIDFAQEEVLKFSPKRVLILGIAFKANTDDLRESPAVFLAQKLQQSGLEVAVFDEHVQPEKLLGANLQFLREKYPKLVTALRSNLDLALDEGHDLVVIAQANTRFNDALIARPNQKVLDLAGSGYNLLPMSSYKGLTW